MSTIKQISHSIYTVPVLTLVMRRIECRVMAGAGAVLSVIGMLLSAFVTDIWQLILTYSVTAGMMLI